MPNETATVKEYKNRGLFAVIVQSSVIAVLLAAALVRPATADAPAGTLRGQRVLACGLEQPFDITVDETAWVKDAGGATARGMFAVAIASVSNAGSRPAPFLGNLQVRDERGRVFNYAFLVSTSAVAAEYGTETLYTEVGPGFGIRAAFLFDVPADVQSLTLEARDASCWR